MNDEPEIQQFNTPEELLRFLQERSDDIDKVSIPTGPIMITDAQGRPWKKTRPGMILKLVGGKLSMICHDDAEMVLNDGILNRMNIRIELMKDGDTAR